MKSIPIKSILYSISSFFLLSLLGPTSIVVAQGKPGDAASKLFPDASSNLLAAGIGNFGRGAEALGNLVNLSTAIAVSLAFLFFFYNLYKYIKEASPESKEEAKTKMGWSLLAIIVITSLWAIIAFVRAVIGLGDGKDAQGDVFVPGFKVGSPEPRQG